MLLGAHFSASGGAHKAFAFADAWHCTAMQIFTKSPNQWASRALTDEECAKFATAAAQSGVMVVTAHDSYLINLASPDPLTLEKSQHAFRVELERCERLGVPFLVTHMGSHMGAGEEAGLRQLAASIDKVHDELTGYRVQILLEATAGQGNHLGYTFEHLAEVLARVKANERLGVCLDSCHLFVAGYDLRDERSYKATMRRFGRLVGFNRLKCFHLNDAKTDLGSRRDRHERIGKGKIGREGFRLIMQDRRLAKVPKIIETPDVMEVGDQDLRLLRRLAV
ncbi:MAG: deoxyribonuclease IV [Chloroflexi bacterium]|nr:deoxyribonuclease IV [Chloroflexota bacterium]